VAPRKKHEQKPRTEQSVPGDPACAQIHHAEDHVATLPGCQLTKIQLLVLLKRRPDPFTRFLFSLSLVKRYATIGNAFAQVPQTRRSCAPQAYFVSVLAIDDAYVILGARSFRT
jgi:hypothetical protein